MYTQEASEAWTEIAEPEPVYAPPVLRDGPTLGPLSLGPTPANEPSSSSLPPVAIVLDGEALHRGMATRLASRGFPMAGGGGGCNTYTRHTSLSFIPSQPRIVPVPVSLCPGLSRGAGKRTDRQTYYRPTGGVGLETRSQRVYLRSDCLPTVYRYARSVPAQRRGIPRSTTAPARARVRGV
jgi:hypothetical protein